MAKATEGHKAKPPYMCSVLKCRRHWLRRWLNPETGEEENFCQEHFAERKAATSGKEENDGTL